MNSVSNNALTSNNALAQSTQQSAKQESGGQASMVESMAKSKGVPDEVIAKGRSAIKAWMKENGKAPSQGKESKKAANSNSAKSLTEQLSSSGISQESFMKALSEGPEATKELFKQNGFNLDVTA